MKICQRLCNQKLHDWIYNLIDVEMRINKALIRHEGCPKWISPLLFADNTNIFFATKHIWYIHASIVFNELRFCGHF